MKLTINTPFQTLSLTHVGKIIAPTTAGEWCFLPRHADAVIALIDGLLIATGQEEKETIIGLRSGLLVKVEETVRIATPQAFQSEHLESIGEAAQLKLDQSGETGKQTEATLARLEAGLIRKLQSLERAHA